jgi:acyl-homoserine-lactone acylase
MLRVLVPVTALIAACAPLRSVITPGADPAERIARSVTIVRDEWGVPTVYGPTDAAVAFGLAYAQAEDNYWQIEEDYIHALGRAAHYHGDRYLVNDLVKAAFEVERLSREEYAREPAERRAVWDAFAAGLNYYLRTRPEVRPRLISPWEPWMFFARFRTVDAGTIVDGVRVAQVAALAGASDVPDASDIDGNATYSVHGGAAQDAQGPDGSAAWAIAGSRTANGHALLFQNPHDVFFGAGQRYEMQVHSGTGWHVRGLAMLGTPVPQAGHNERLAWSHTVTGADHADVYEVIFDHPTDPLAYRYGNEWRRAVEWVDTLQVNTAQGVVSRVYRFRRTHHGPIVAMRDGRGLAVRIARLDEGGSLQQWLEMGRAASLDEFRTALNRRALPTSNTMYADVEGNIYYLHGNAVPQRPAGFEWTRPVDGNSPDTEWQGWHELSELPELLNPAGGWLQSTGATPFLAAAAGDNPDPDRFAAYMAPDADNARARSSRRLLEAESRWTLDALQHAAFDTWVSEATDDAFRILIHEWEEVGGTNAERAMRVDEALDAVRGWDRVASVESVETTLYVLWQERLRSGTYTGAYVAFRAFEDVIAELRHNFGSALVPWGDVNRLQRVHTGGGEPFRSDVATLPVPGAPERAGAIFAFNTRPGADGRRYGVSGATWVSVVELVPGGVRSRSIVQFGQSADPSSPHWFDQAPLYAAGELKRVWFTREEVAGSARRTYAPGTR